MPRRIPSGAWLVKYVIAALLDIIPLIGSTLGTRRRTAELGAERGEARLDLLETAALRELAERAAIGRDGVGLLPGELLHASEPQEELFVVEVLRAEAGERDLEGVDRLRVVALGLPRVRDAALAQRLESPRRPLGDGKLKSAASLDVLLSVVAEITELVGHLGGAGTRGILRESSLELPNPGGSRVGGRLGPQRGLGPRHGVGVRGHRMPLRDGVPVPAPGAKRARGQDRDARDQPRAACRHGQDRHHGRSSVTLENRHQAVIARGARAGTGGRRNHSVSSPGTRGARGGRSAGSAGT